MKPDFDLMIYGDTKPADGREGRGWVWGRGGWGSVVLTRSNQRSLLWRLESPCA